MSDDSKGAAQLVAARIEEVTRRYESTVAHYVAMVKRIEEARSQYDALYTQSVQFHSTMVKSNQEAAEQLTKMLIRTSEARLQYRETVKDYADMVERIEEARTLYGAITERVETVTADLATLQAQQLALYQRLDAFEQRSRSTASLLEEFEHTIKPKGTKMRAWLAAIGASERYQSLVALRARRRKR